MSDLRPISDLRPEAITTVLDRIGLGLGRPYFYLPTVSSTNDLARDLARRGEPEGTLVVAEAQTAGRGRLGRSWHSPPGTGLWCSLVLRPGVTGAALASLPIVAGLAAVRAVLSLGGLPLGIKWPNDIVVGDRKVGGLLAEAGQSDDGRGFVVLGFGLNVAQEAQDFPPELRETAISLAMAGRPVARSSALVGWLTALEGLYRRWLDVGFAAIAPEVSRHLVTLGQRVTVFPAAAGGAPWTGRALALDPSDGALLVEADDDAAASAPRRVVAGDVTIRAVR